MVCCTIAVMDELKKKESLINELADLCGIVQEYWDIFGERHTASLQSKARVLQAMGFEDLSEQALLRYIERLKHSSWTRLIEPVFVFSNTEGSLRIPLHLQLNDKETFSIEWRLCPKDDNRILYSGYIIEPVIEQERLISDNRYIETSLTITTFDHRPFEIGYYDLSVTVRFRNTHIEGRSRIIVTPDRCYLPLQEDRTKHWGLVINLYSLRSGRNWGIGDFTDLELCVEEVARAGGDFVGINPLHAITNQYPYGISPYSPISRLFRNFIYLDLESIDGFAELPNREAILKQTDALRTSEYINYDAVAALKLKTLKTLFEHFYTRHLLNGTVQSKPFQEFLQRGGKTLEDFALFCALADYHGKDNALYSWRAWNEGFHNPDTPASLEFKSKHKKELLFYCYVQWQIDCQLKSVYQKASQMQFGLYNDLAVGSIRDGFDEWIYQDSFAISANAGAPPDDFNPAGQDWGFPPFNPITLREHAYEPFIKCLKMNMHYAGALRIDHALGLFRMFWIPISCRPSEGVYVRYPHKDLLRIIALESHLNKTVVIAEDLGTVTDEARESLKAFDMLSYKLLYFQRYYPDPHFIKPEEYPARSLCSVTTHDLPTLTGFWTARDIELRKRLSLFKSQEDYSKALKERQRDRTLLIETLINHGILPKDYTPPEEMIPSLIVGVYEYLARSNSMMLGVGLDDLMKTVDQQNMPGTVTEYPCWRQKTPQRIEDLFNSQVMRELTNMLSKYRRK